MALHLEATMAAPERFAAAQRVALFTAFAAYVIVGAGVARLYDGPDVNDSVPGNVLDALPTGATPTIVRLAMAAQDRRAIRALLRKQTTREMGTSTPAPVAVAVAAAMPWALAKEACALRSERSSRMANRSSDLQSPPGAAAKQRKGSSGLRKESTGTCRDGRRSRRTLRCAALAGSGKPVLTSSLRRAAR